jgi:hypothetical protein
MYVIGAGSPPSHCHICGGRVPGLLCKRHPRPDGQYVGLRDKHLDLFFIRSIPQSIASAQP